MDIDRSRVDPALGIPGEVEQLSTAERATGVGREDREQQELLGSHVDGPATATELARDEVELDAEIGCDREGARPGPETRLDGSRRIGVVGSRARRGGTSCRSILEPQHAPGRGARPCPPVPCGAAPGSVPMEVALESHWPIVARSR